MKNYIVKALFNFNDVEEKNEYGFDTPRIADKSIWKCTKERFEYLKSKNAVMLVGIDEIKEEQKEETKVESIIEEKPKPKTTKKKTTKK